MTTTHITRIRTALAAMKQAADAQLLATADLREAINDYDAYLLDWAEHQDPSPEYQLTNVTESAPARAVLEAAEALDTYFHGNTQPTKELTESAPAPAPESEKPVTEATPEPVEDSPEPTQPDPSPEVTFEEVRAKLSDLARAGHKDTVKDLIADLGAGKLSEVPEEKYPVLLAVAEKVAA